MCTPARARSIRLEIPRTWSQKRLRETMATRFNGARPHRARTFRALCGRSRINGVLSPFATCAARSGESSTGHARLRTTMTDPTLHSIMAGIAATTRAGAKEER
jgi:hypothetical protein